MNPKACLHPGFHFLGDLATILQPFQLTLRGHDRLKKFVLGRVADAVVQALDAHAPSMECVPQVEMKPCVTGKPLQIIKDHNERFIRLRIDVAEESDHAWSLHEVAATRDRIRKNGDDLVATRHRVFSTARFLRNEAVSFRFLLS